MSFRNVFVLKNSVECSYPSRICPIADYFFQMWRHELFGQRYLLKVIVGLKFFERPYYWNNLRENSLFVCLHSRKRKKDVGSLSYKNRITLWISLNDIGRIETFFATLYAYWNIPDSLLSHTSWWYMSNAGKISCMFFFLYNFKNY